MSERIEMIVSPRLGICPKHPDAEINHVVYEYHSNLEIETVDMWVCDMCGLDLVEEELKRQSQRGSYV